MEGHKRENICKLYPTIQLVNQGAINAQIGP
jgi:hypothetical protein